MDKPWKVIAAFIGVFVFGAVFGGLLTFRIDHPPAAKRPAAIQPGPLSAVLRLHAEQLELTPEQREKIRPLVERAEEDLRRTRQNGLRETGVVLKRFQEDLSIELTPVQLKKLQKIQERMQERLHDDRNIFQPLRERPANPKRNGAAKDESPAAKPEAPVPAPGK